jgi:hypothetical protein
MECYNAHTWRALRGFWSGKHVSRLLLEHVSVDSWHVCRGVHLHDVPIRYLTSRSIERDAWEVQQRVSSAVKSTIKCRRSL